jgi:hypothetical protein
MYAADEIITKDNIVPGVSYLVSLDVGKKVHSVAQKMGSSCHHATPSIPLLHVRTEIIPTRVRPTGSYYPFVGNIRINWKHAPLLFGSSVVI